MLNITIQPNILQLPSLPTIGINTKLFVIVKDHAAKVTEKIAQNKFISAFTTVLTGPV